MKKVLVLFMLVVFSGCAHGESVGTLGRVGSNPEYETSMLAYVFDKSFDSSNTSIKFYDSAMMMQLALNRGEIDSMSAPEFVGEYMLRNNKNYYLRGFIILKTPVALAFGFTDNKKELCDKFSRVVEAVESEGVIGILARDYITGPAALNPPVVELANFPDAETLTVAVTGDMPPLDYVSPDGKAAGFNVALLAEIARRLHVNIKFVNVDTGSRVAALKSGRADAVFWFQIFRGYEIQPDVPEGIITSTPYYGWNKVLLLGTR